MEEIKNSRVPQKENADPNQKVLLDGKPLTVAMIIGLKESRKPKDKQEALLSKMTHLRMEAKNIELIECLEKMPHLTHIYLQENKIYTLVNDPFPKLTNLVQLSLYDN